jgi:hypothetical protein
MPYYGWLTIGILIGPWVWIGAFWLMTFMVDILADMRRER